MNTSFQRALQHTPLGVLAAWLGGTPAVLIVIMFLAYEVTEDWRINDSAYIDIKSFMVGYIGYLTFYDRFFLEWII